MSKSYLVRIECPRKEILELYQWLDVFCPSWEFEASYSTPGPRNHSKMRKNNEDFVRTCGNPSRMESTAIRVYSAKEAAAPRIHFLNVSVVEYGS